jgi:hypothetical protein
MLDLDEIDIASLAEALEDHSDETNWWFNPSTGEVTPLVSDFSDDLEEESFIEGGLVLIESYGSREATGIWALS